MESRAGDCKGGDTILARLRAVRYDGRRMGRIRDPGVWPMNRNSIWRASWRLKSVAADPSLTLRVSVLVLVVLCCAARAHGQVPSRSAPHDGYWNCFASFRDGDF